MDKSSDCGNPDYAITNAISVSAVIADIRAYAASKGVPAAIGAQTGDQRNGLTSRILIMSQESPRRVGTGLWKAVPVHRDISDNSRCFALLWDPRYTSVANQRADPFFDWNGSADDDLHRFAGMTQDAWAKFLKDTYAFFKAKNIGFLPVFYVVIGSATPISSDLYRQQTVSLFGGKRLFPARTKTSPIRWCLAVL